MNRKLKAAEKVDVPLVIAKNGNCSFKHLASVCGEKLPMVFMVSRYQP